MVLNILYTTSMYLQWTVLSSAHTQPFVSTLCSNCRSNCFKSTLLTVLVVAISYIRETNSQMLQCWCWLILPSYNVKWNFIFPFTELFFRLRSSLVQVFQRLIESTMLLILRLPSFLLDLWLSSFSLDLWLPLFLQVHKLWTIVLFFHRWTRSIVKNEAS